MSTNWEATANTWTLQLQLKQDHEVSSYAGCKPKANAFTQLHTVIHTHRHIQTHTCVQYLEIHGAMTMVAMVTSGTPDTMHIPINPSHSCSIASYVCCNKLLLIFQLNLTPCKCNCTVILWNLRKFELEHNAAVASCIHSINCCANWAAEETKLRCCAHTANKRKLKITAWFAQNINLKLIAVIPLAYG